MTTNYKRGAAAEYTAMRMLEADGWFVFRMAGSHSPVDVLALNDQGEVLMVQVKSGKTSFGPKQREKAFAELRGVSGPTRTRRELWHLRRKGPGRPGEWTVYTEGDA